MTVMSVALTGVCNWERRCYFWDIMWGRRNSWS